MSRPRRIGTVDDLSRRIPSVMRSEFGRVIENLMDVPGAQGAVLVDDDGYAIDYVFDPESLDDIDVQLAGAQLGQIVLRAQVTSARWDLGSTSVVLEGPRGSLVTGPVGEHYVLTFLLDHDAELLPALDHFEAVRSTVEHLLT